LYKLNEYTKAITDLTKSIAQAFNLPLSYTLRAMAFYGQAYNDSAMLDYNAAIDADNSFAKAYYNRGILKAALLDFDGAIAITTRLLPLPAKI